MSWILIFIVGGLGGWFGRRGGWNPEDGGLGPPGCIQCGFVLGGIVALVLVAVLGAAVAGFGVVGQLGLAVVGGWFGGPALTSALQENGILKG